MVLDGLGGETAIALDPQVGADLPLVDAVQRPVAEERLEVAAQVAAVVLDRRPFALHHILEVIDVGGTGRGDPPPLSSGNQGGVLVDPPAQLALGLYPREPLAASALAFQAKLAVGLAAAGRAPAPVPALTSARVALNVEGAGAVGAFRHPCIVTRARSHSSGFPVRTAKSRLRGRARVVRPPGRSVIAHRCPGLRVPRPTPRSPHVGSGGTGRG